MKRRFSRSNTLSTFFLVLMKGMDMELSSKLLPKQLKLTHFLMNVFKVWLTINGEDLPRNNN